MKQFKQDSEAYLHVSNLVLLPLVLLHLVFQQLKARPHKGIIITTIVLQFFLVHVDHIGTHAIEEVLRCRQGNRKLLV